MRPGQAKDRYDLAKKQMISKRPKDMQSIPGSAPRFAKLKKEADDAQAALILANLETEKGHGVQDVSLVVAGGLHDDSDEDMGPRSGAAAGKAGLAQRCACLLWMIDVFNVLRLLCWIRMFLICCLETLLLLCWHYCDACFRFALVGSLSMRRLIEFALID